MKFSRTFRVISLVLLWLSVTPRNVGGALFEFAASAGRTQLAIGTDDLVPLVKSLILNSGRFAVFDGRPTVRASMSYLGLANALNFVITEAPGGTVANLSSKYGPVSRNFGGPGFTREEVSRQVESFFNNEASKDYANFLKAIRDTTPNLVFQNPTIFPGTGGATPGPGWVDDGLGTRGGTILADFGVFDINGVKGQIYTLPLSTQFRLSKRVALDVGLPLTYIQIGDASVYGTGVNLGLPVKVILKRTDDPWFWQVTPFVGAKFTASKEISVGGLVLNGGLGNLLAYDFGPFEVSMGNQFSLAESLAVEFGGVNVDPGFTEQLLRNGLKVAVPIGRRWAVEVYGVHTMHLEPVLIDQYYTFGVDVGYRVQRNLGPWAKKAAYLKAGTYTELGNNYSAFHFQFGGGFKF